MDFRLTPEQEMLRDSAAEALRRCGDGRWGKALAEAGALGILVPELQGGLGLGMVEAALVAEACGYARASYPIAEVLTALPALAERKPDAAAAILAGGGDAAASGSLLNREAMRLDALPKPDPHSETSLALLRIAEMAGLARFSFEMAVAYLKDRTQFGRPIGANQALKHMAADDFVRQENIRVALHYACAAQDWAERQPGDAEAVEEAARSHRVLLAYAPDAARQIVENAIQMHGGIGMTWDYALNVPLRRVLRLASLLGPAEAHRRGLARTLLAESDRAPFRFDAAAE